MTALIANVASLRDFERFLRSCALRSRKPLELGTGRLNQTLSAHGQCGKRSFFARLRARERVAERPGSLFWRDRIHEVDFAVDVGGRGRDVIENMTML